jgi:hypothetical protein
VEISFILSEHEIVQNFVDVVSLKLLTKLRKFLVFQSRGNAVDIVTGIRAVLKPSRGKACIFSLKLGPTQPHIQWVPCLKRAGREADIPYFVPTLRMCGAVPSLRHM